MRREERRKVALRENEIVPTDFLNVVCTFAVNFKTFAKLLPELPTESSTFPPSLPAR